MRRFPKKFNLGFFFLYLFAFLYGCNNQSQKGISLGNSLKTNDTLSEPLVKYYLGPNFSSSYKKIEERLSSRFLSQTSRTYPQHPPLHPEDAELSKSKIFIQKESLNKEFFFQTFFSTQQYHLPYGTSLKTKIVTFERNEDQLLMFDVTKKNENEGEFNSFKILLASFPIVQEDMKYIYFDFNWGINKIFLQSEMYFEIDDEDDLEKIPFPKSLNDNSFAIEIKESYVESSEYRKNERFVINQMAQVKDVNGFFSTVKLRYFLTPYEKNFEFEPHITAKNNQSRFFEVSPIPDNNGMIVVHAIKFDVSKPIIFAISANTPPEYKEAIRDGVLYWNKAFRRQLIKVIDAPQGKIAPDDEYNMIQWVNSKNTMLAYADMQVDPRTGEMKHAQIHIFSGWVGFEKNNFHSLMGMDYAPKAIFTSSQKKMPDVFNPKFIQRVCDYQMRNDPFLFYHASNPTWFANEEQFKLALQDVLRTVVAHEAGHILGIRHNFAGSKQRSAFHRNYSELFSEYLKNGSIDVSHILSSTVMDYLDLKVDAMLGSQIRQGTEALPYDEIAVKMLYENQNIEEENQPLFCTDESISKYIECELWDVGESLAYAAEKISRKIARISVNYVMTYLQMIFIKKPKENIVYQNEKVLIEEFKKIDSDKTAKLFYQNQEKLMDMFLDRTRSLVLERLIKQGKSVTGVDYFKDDLAGVGDINSIFMPIPENFVKNAQSLFEKSLAKSIDVRELSLSEDGKNKILNHSKEFFVKLEKSLIEKELSLIFQKLTLSKDEDVNIKLSHFVLDRAKEVLTFFNVNKVESNSITDDVCKMSEFPIFKYSLQQREKALLQVGDDEFHQRKYLSKVKKDIKQELESLLERYTLKIINDERCKNREMDPKLKKLHNEIAMQINQLGS